MNEIKIDLIFTCPPVDVPIWESPDEEDRTMPQGPD